MLNLKPLPPNFDPENRALANPLTRNRKPQAGKSNDTGDGGIILACMMLHYIEKINGMQPLEIKKIRQISKKDSGMYKKLSTGKKITLEAGVRASRTLKGV
jgi:hypothetical protein